MVFNDLLFFLSPGLFMSLYLLSQAQFGLLSEDQKAGGLLVLIIKSL